MQNNYYDNERGICHMSRIFAKLTTGKMVKKCPEQRDEITKLSPNSTCCIASRHVTSRHDKYDVS